MMSDPRTVVIAGVRNLITTAGRMNWAFSLAGRKIN